MLTKLEDKIMYAVFCACNGKNSCLISPEDIINMADIRGDVTYDSLEKVLEELEYDDYFDLVLSDRKGEKVYCITLHEKGQGYKRQKVIVKRTLGFKLVITVIFALVSFAITLLLRLLI